MEKQTIPRTGYPRMGRLGLNNQRLHSAIGYIPPAEAKKNYYNQRASNDKLAA